jgi:adenine-specific DNA-methyltransferase
MSAKDEEISKQSMDLGEFNKERLLEMFPTFRTEGGGVDFDRLKLTLGESVDVGKEVFGMRWPGKADSIRLANDLSYGTLSPDEKESVNFDTTQNLIIEGDNLEVLKLLQKSYQGKVKMIYIDPPYNTGNDFVYEDDFSDGIKNYLQQTGQINDEGNRLSTNSETDGRFHSNWMNMMYPRLRLAHNLLTDNGVIFVSIDDHEVQNLRLMLNEVFGEENFIGQFIWVTKNAARGVPPKTMLMSNHEYVLAFAKNINFVKFLGIERDVNDFDNPDNDPRGLWRSESIKATGSQNNYFTIVDPKSQNQFHANWAFSESSIQKMIEDGLIIFPDGKSGTPRQKKFINSYLNDRKAFVTNLGWYSTENATKALMDLFGGKKIFDFPKPVDLIAFLVEQATSEDVVLDFFAGSGTTAHAVMAQNAKDGGARKFILVQLPERTDPESEAAKAGFDSIVEITKERVRRASKKITDDSDSKLKLKGEGAIDFGFRVLKLNESNIEDWNSEEASKSPKDLLDALKTTRLKSGRSDQDVVFEVLIKYGIELTLKVEEEKVGKGSIWKVDGGELIVIVSAGLTVADLHSIVKMSPRVVVMLDESFVPESLKTNARATFKDAKIELKTF